MLQILAFWLSLLRYFYCEKRVLRLGKKLMDLITTWSKTDGLGAEEHDLVRRRHRSCRGCGCSAPLCPRNARLRLLQP